MKAVIQIPVLEEVGKFLNTREASSLLFNIISKNKGAEIEFDFTGVEFMSRSFADQFHKEKLQFQEKENLVLYIINANEEIIKILQAVANTQNKKDRKFVSLPVFRFSDEKLLSDYLLSI